MSGMIPRPVGFCPGGPRTAAGGHPQAPGRSCDIATRPTAAPRPDRRSGRAVRVGAVAVTECGQSQFSRAVDNLAGRAGGDYLAAILSRVDADEARGFVRCRVVGLRREWPFALLSAGLGARWWARQASNLRPADYEFLPLFLYNMLE